MRFVKPLDEGLLHQIFEKHENIITIEDGVIKGGFGSSILEFASENKYTNKLKTLGIPDKFIAHGSVLQLQQKIGLDVKSLLKILNNIAF
jgi:1-deoxy-D-xylulose-5-phosphate synthase